MTDFVGLCRAARELPGPDTHDRLWSAWFDLPTWHCIRAPSPTGWLPFSAFINGQRCVLGFTTGERADGYSRHTGIIPPHLPSAVMSLPPEAMIQMVPRLRMYGVLGLVVDPGPDSFYAQLDHLYAMFRRYRTPAREAPAQPPPPPPAPRPPPPAAAPQITVESMLALPRWHVITTQADPSFPELAFSGSELVAQVFSSPQAVARHAGSPTPPVAVLPPARVLALLADIELVGLVRFDDQLEVDLVDLKLRADRHD